MHNFIQRLFLITAFFAAPACFAADFATANASNRFIPGDEDESSAEYTHAHAKANANATSCASSLVSTNSVTPQDEDSDGEYVVYEIGKQPPVQVDDEMDSLLSSMSKLEVYDWLAREQEWYPEEHNWQDDCDENFVFLYSSLVERNSIFLQIINRCLFALRQGDRCAWKAFVLAVDAIKPNEGKKICRQAASPHASEQRASARAVVAEAIECVMPQDLMEVLASIQAENVHDREIVAFVAAVFNFVDQAAVTALCASQDPDIQTACENLIFHTDVQHKNEAWAHLILSYEEMILLAAELAKSAKYILLKASRERCSPNSVAGVTDFASANEACAEIDRLVLDRALEFINKLAGALKQQVSPDFSDMVRARLYLELELDKEADLVAGCGKLRFAEDLFSYTAYKAAAVSKIQKAWLKRR